MTDKSKDNLAIWTRNADIDPKHTKAITGKPYKGTSPKPQEIVRMMTEEFGPVGKGFGWEIVADGWQPLGETILHWCKLRIWWREGDAVHSFEEYGQTKAYYKTTTGVLADEDAPKKSMTDALVKGASHLGFAASIFMGLYDDSKYVAGVAADFRDADDPKSDAKTSIVQKPAENPLSDTAKPTRADVDRIKERMALCNSMGELDEIAKSEASVFRAMPDPWQKEIREASKNRAAALTEMPI